MNNKIYHEIFNLNALHIDSKDIPQGFNIYPDYQNGRIDDVLLLPMLKTNMPSNNSNRSYTKAYGISTKLYTFLVQWGVFSSCSYRNKLKQEPIILENKIPFDSYNIDINTKRNTSRRILSSPKKSTYQCDSHTVFKELNNIVQLKQGVDKLSKTTGNDIVTDIILLLASFMNEGQALQMLKKFSAHSVKSKATDKIFRHKYKIVHPKTIITNPI
jgi:hypothetical protein